MNAIQAFDIERAKQVVEESPLIDWTIRGTTLVATVPWLGDSYDVEVTTEYADKRIEAWTVDVTWLEAPPLTRGESIVMADGRQFRERHLSEAKNEKLFAMLHESAGEFLYFRSYSICLAHDRALAEGRADDSRDFEQGIGC